MKTERPAMLRAHSSLILRPSSLFRHRGYSFTEVMFAVVVLGIGFIMIAAMFPVAISQQASTQEETNGASIARGAMVYINNIAFTRYDLTNTILPDEKQNMPATEAPGDVNHAPMVPFDKIDTTAAGAPEARHGLFPAISGDLILSADDRYAFVPFYRRESGSSVATVTVVAVKVRARSKYDASDLVVGAPQPRPNLMARVVAVDIQDNVGSSGVDWISFTGPNAAAVGEGSYVIIGNSPAAGTTPVGAFNARIYRVGQKAEAIGASTPGPTTWELMPGNDYKDLPGPDGALGTPDDQAMPNNTVAWIVGREFDLETGPTDDFRGNAQDVSVYTSFVTVR